MTFGPFSVGEQPSTPLLLTVTKADGTAVNLDAYDDITVVGLPEGSTTVASASQGRVQYTFAAPFTEAGTVRFRVRLVQDDGDTDYSPWAEVQVFAEPVTRVSTAQAYTTTAQQVSAERLLQAQVQIALVVDRDLADADIWAALAERDQKLLRQAIAWQAVELGRVADTGLGSLPGPVQSMNTAGQSVTFATGTTLASSTTLSPVVVQVLNRLSWRRRQISAHLEADARGPAPDPWVRHIDYVVGHNFGLYVGTLP